MSTQSYFVISLDFELYWGMFDKVTLREYGDNIRGVHTVIPKILAIFKDNDIHATWAVVGMLAAQNKAELLQLLPTEELRPKYPDMRVSSYEHLKSGPVVGSQSVDPYHFGAHLLREIINTPNQEIGSHTFSHYYCIDGCSNEIGIFAADCEAFNRALSPFSVVARSIVFPRNQTTDEALKVIKEKGFVCYRGTPNNFLYNAKAEAKQSNLFLRAGRLIDAYFNLTGHHTYPLSAVNEKDLKNVRASRFLRSYSKTLSFMEPLRLTRIKNAMTYAAKNGEIFHLWWHPHNFGVNQEENLSVIKSLIEHYLDLKESYGMKSTTMFEVARTSLK
jgi:peptidoglycan/xylan/chitin deacetylase (PgdA/CDA1 family)